MTDVLVTEFFFSTAHHHAHVLDFNDDANAVGTGYFAD